MEKDLSQKIFFFQKNTLCHSFRIIVIPSILLSFLPDYCHSFRIIVIRSELVSFLPNIVIPFKLFRELQIPTSSKSFPYPKGEKNGHLRWPYMRVYSKCTPGQLPNSSHPLWVGLLLHPPKADDWNWAKCTETILYWNWQLLEVGNWPEVHSE